MNLVLRNAIIKTAKTANSQFSRAMKEEATRRNKTAAGEYLFLRVTPKGYDWGKKRDPDGLLPNVFKDGY